MLLRDSSYRWVRASKDAVSTYMQVCAHIHTHSCKIWDVSTHLHTVRARAHTHTYICIITHKCLHNTNAQILKCHQSFCLGVKLDVTLRAQHRKQSWICFFLYLLGPPMTRVCRKVRYPFPPQPQSKMKMHPVCSYRTKAPSGNNRNILSKLAGREALLLELCLEKEMINFTSVHAAVLMTIALLHHLLNKGKTHTCSLMLHN